MRHLVHEEVCSVIESKGRKGQCLYNEKWEREPCYKGWVLPAEIDEIKKKKRRVDSDMYSLNETADELCSKAESTGKLPFMTQLSSLQTTANDKIQELIDLDVVLNS